MDFSMFDFHTIDRGGVALRAYLRGIRQMRARACKGGGGKKRPKNNVRT